MKDRGWRTFPVLLSKPDTGKEGARLVYEVVYCSDCQKPIKSVPSWMSDVKVRFTCESCRQKHPKALAAYEPVVAARSSRDEDGDDPETAAVAGDEEPGDDDLVEDAAFEEAAEE